MTRLLSPSSLSRFLGCEPRTYLDLLDERGALDARRFQPNAELLLRRGRLHEERILDGLRDEGRSVVPIPESGAVADRAAATEAALGAGPDVIHQACLSDDGWVGYADFLVKVHEKSWLGDYAYEVHDAKLGSHPRPGHIFQLMFYNERLAALQGRRPAAVHLILGNEESRTFDPDDFAAYDDRIRRRFLTRREQLAGRDPNVSYPYPVPDCDFCPWWKHCADRRRVDDHLSLVANLQRSQGLKLESGGVATLTALAGLPEGRRIPRLPTATLTTLRAQADLQLRSGDLDVPLYELLRPEHGRGLARLPMPSEGDVFFDFEGDPYWGDDGLEYLFGTVARADGRWSYEARWATSRNAEKEAFEDWMVWITHRLARHPDLHVFHYNAYEPTAIKRLMARHGTMVHEVDELLRRKVFVDLYGVIRQGLRAGVESYGLKALEPLTGFRRTHDAGSLSRWQEFQDAHDATLLKGIAAYNEEDCRSTRAVRDWLMERRPEAEARFGVKLARLEPEPERPPSDRQQRYRERVEVARSRVTRPGVGGRGLLAQPHGHAVPHRRADAAREPPMPLRRRGTTCLTTTPGGHSACP